MATLLDEGASSSAVRMLRSAWEPELPTHDLIPLYCMWIRALCDMGDLDHAIILARRAADELSDEPDILIALGNVHDLRGELPASRDAFRRAIEANAMGSLAHYNLGAVLERLGEEDEAEDCYRNALDSDDEPGTMYEAAAALGALLRRNGRLEEAAGVYEQYLDEDPINVDILVEHGICLSDLDEFEQAVERFELALTLETDHAGAWYNLAITLYRMGQPEEAMTAMDKALRADPESPLTLAVLGSWYLAHGQGEAHLDEALRMLYGALELLTDSSMSDNLSPSYASLVFEEVFEALWQRGLRGEAREVARRAGQRDWITAHVLNTLNEVDHGDAPQVSAFTVTARVEAGEVPEYWPRDVQGYTRGLTVLAADEDEARHYSLEFLRTIEAPGVQFEIEMVRPGAPDELPYDMVRPRARGVVGFASGRAYFR
ncbi:tetratricopeptide repeat protein [Paraliomyxa miuraensis]|uniref:tetratricopeptide repeat protein n=1 Tax=Paraliomyxa miuraensis TaxID=376150 RepID=UPI00225B4118|nr:tetratricopeptide repeat protein [Paraliomyxa miuraensis]MCX4241127.1 tetratricopeptide repeat protein [Paraliomyxa miuraensis]